MTELEKKYQELVIYLKALTISHSPDEKYENRLLSEIAELKEQQEKSDVDLLQDIYDRNDMEVIVNSDIYLQGFEEGLGYKENKKEQKEVPVSTEEIKRKINNIICEYLRNENYKTPKATSDLFDLFKKYAIDLTDIEPDKFHKQQGEVTDEMIEKWADITAIANSIPSYKWGLIEGAKTMRDNKIK